MTRGDDQVVAQINKQLNKLVSVIEVMDFTEASHVERELALIKVTADQSTRAEVMHIVDIFRGKVIDVSPQSYLIEVTGAEDKITALLELLLDLAEAFHLLGRRHHRATPRQHSFYGLAHFVDLADQLAVDAAHRGPTVRQNDDEAFSLELLQRLADGVGADAIVRRQLLHLQLRSGCVDASDYPGADGVAHARVVGAADRLGGPQLNVGVDLRDGHRSRPGRRGMGR